MVNNFDRVIIAWLPCAEGIHGNENVNGAAEASLTMSSNLSVNYLFIYMKGNRILTSNPETKRIKVN